MAKLFVSSKKINKKLGIAPRLNDFASTKWRTRITGQVPPLLLAKIDSNTAFIASVALNQEMIAESEPDTQVFIDELKNLWNLIILSKNGKSAQG